MSNLYLWLCRMDCGLRGAHAPDPLTIVPGSLDADRREETPKMPLVKFLWLLGVWKPYTIPDVIGILWPTQLNLIPC
jgi:hypothetical protein